MMTFSKEYMLLEPVSAYIRNLEFSEQLTELQFYEHRIDLYCFSPLKNLTAAIELKLEKWQRAYNQALLYQLCADLVFIALPFETTQHVNTEILDEYGIGLLAVDNNSRCINILPAKQSKVIREHYRKVYIEMLEKETTCLR